MLNHLVGEGLWEKEQNQIKREEQSYGNLKLDDRKTEL